MGQTHSFTRPTILAAIELLEAGLSQARFDQMIIRVELENKIALGKGLSVSAKAAQFSYQVLQLGEQTIATVEGYMTRSEAVIREAVKAILTSSDQHQQTFLRGLARDGYVVSKNENSGSPLLRAALPTEINLPETDDEVSKLLIQFNFFTPKGHLFQAIDAHTRGDWAAANAQIRTFMEALFDEIARYAFPTEASQCMTSDSRRTLLMNLNFLSSSRNELTPDGRNYINGLFKMLHSDGSHPGLSDEDHCTFRLHITLITARTFLRRLNNRT